MCDVFYLVFRKISLIAWSTVWNEFPDDVKCFLELLLTDKREGFFVKFLVYIFLSALSGV